MTKPPNRELRFSGLSGSAGVMRPVANGPLQVFSVNVAA
jgi:hypothetical protein